MSTLERGSILIFRRSGSESGTADVGVELVLLLLWLLKSAILPFEPRHYLVKASFTTSESKPWVSYELEAGN